MLDTSRASPSADDLRAAVEALVSRWSPDQIILFGSGARGEMTDHSDLDLLVITEHPSARTRSHDRWWNETTARDIDAFISTKADAQKAREYAGNPRGAALETGRTIYTRPGFSPVETGLQKHQDAEMNPQATRYRPDRAFQFLARAERKGERANQPGTHPTDRCEDLQVAIEQSLKALTIAEGRQITHTHDLVKLWEDAEQNGNRIPVERDNEQLKKLSRYAGIYLYEDPTDGAPEITWDATKATGDGVLNHARATVPTLVEHTRSNLGDADMPGSRRRTGETATRPTSGTGTKDGTAPTNKPAGIVRGAGRPVGGKQLEER